MFWSSFSRILPDGFEQIRPYTDLSGPFFFVFLTPAGDFVATAPPQSDVGPTCAHVPVHLGDAFDTTENTFSSSIYNAQITTSPISSFSVSFFSFFLSLSFIVVLVFVFRVFSSFILGTIVHT